MWSGCLCLLLYIYCHTFIEPIMRPYSNLNSPINTFNASHEKNGMLCIWVGVLGAPIAWVVQLLLSLTLASHACYPLQSPISLPIWQDLTAILMTIGLICLAVALLSGLAAWIAWLEYQRRLNSIVIAVLQSRSHRNRFLIKSGLMSSFLFIVAILFNLCAILLVSPCSAWF